ncbi:decaprenylphospho-beta-D-erythro-pentofuranosid-2-ulose 2-reductase [Lentzea sp. NPDC051208]|uniref:decaprenylphospho-beta-D-erythro-pentofuranosid- 2-ulose 2-reductase n=1 Tax=Lentzea sp. NPDC051208 TaxID=3154642 RepID=UPI00341C86EE
MIDSVGNPHSVLLLGGTSEIGLAVVEHHARQRPLRVVLAARPSARLDAAVERLSTLGCTVHCVPFEARDPDSHATVIGKAFAEGDIDLAVVALGVLGDQEQAWQDVALARELAEVNYVAPVILGVLLAQRMREQGHGAIVALSSVAGERVRRSNFGYGSSKAGMDGFFLGLGEALQPHGVRVLVVRPGFVRTRMTEGMRPAPLSVTPEEVATAVAQGLSRGKELVWVPGPLRFVMSALRHVPRALFRRLPV